MKYSQAKHGRVFIVRLNHGDIVHKCLEKVAKTENIKAAAVIAVGGAGSGSKFVVGPVENGIDKISPMEAVIKNAAEITGTGTIFQDESGKPVVHMHMACGRKRNTITGCIRKGVKTWLVMELIIFELVNTKALRMPDKKTRFAPLEP